MMGKGRVICEGQPIDEKRKREGDVRPETAGQPQEKKTLPIIKEKKEDWGRFGRAG